MTVSLESEPWVPAKDDKGLENLLQGVKLMSVQRARADRCRQVLGDLHATEFAHWVWQAKETGTAADMKLGLVPMRPHSESLQI